MLVRRPSLVVMASALLALACGGGSTGGGGGDKPALAGYVAAVSCDGCTAELKPGAPPAAGAAASPAASALVAAAARATYLRGGTTSFELQAGLARLIIAVEGVDGYWQITLPSGGAPSLLVTFGQDSPDGFTVQLGTDDGTGLAYEQVPVSLISVGTGDVQVNVTWDLDVDVDLHVLDPAGEEIYYNHLTSQSGGQLDLDSNAGCFLDHVRAENITWPTGQAPSGTYKVLVDYWSACTTGPVGYVVTVNVTGQDPHVFQGTFQDTDADEGGACFLSDGTLACGRLIGSFSVP